MRRPLAFDEVAQELAEAVQGIDRIASAIEQQIGNGVVGPKDENRGVDQVNGSGLWHEGRVACDCGAKPPQIQANPRFNRACRGLVRGKWARKYSIWSASTRRPFK